MPNSSNEEIVMQELSRALCTLDKALARWVDTLSPLKRQLVAAVLEDVLEDPEISNMWKPANMKRIGLFFWHSGFPRTEFENMIETYIVFFATKLRGDMIPASSESDDSE